MSVRDLFTLSPDQKGIETGGPPPWDVHAKFTLSPDQKGIETLDRGVRRFSQVFTLSPDQKGIETHFLERDGSGGSVHTEPRSKGD